MDSLTSICGPANDQKNLIIMTHHVPTMMSVVPKYKYEKNYGYVNDLDHLMRHNIPIWIHGHNHYNFLTEIEETLICCNQWGYTHENTNYHRLVVIL